VVSNDELAARLGCDAEWILSASGIRERRYAAEQETVVDLGARAAENCLDRAGVKPAQIGILIAASGTSGRLFPGPAAEIAARLELGPAPALDLPVASAGSLFGMALADSLAASYGTVLVVAAEKMSPYALREPLDRNIAILFGDGAGACLIRRDAGRARIVDSVLYSDGSYAGDLRLGANGLLEMNGRSVIMQASRKIPRAISELLQKNGRAAAEVDAFLMHQANLNLINRVAQSIGAPEEKFYSNIQRYGNTSSASMLIAAAEWEEAVGFQPGRAVVFATFGAGFHWGALLAEGV
jgi:3-oxoacyl-[acyl-carrier-protein] synthase-3